jgi:hypothetical protein
MKHRMEILPRAMESTVHRRQRNRPHGREDQERKSRTLGFRVPGVCLLLILKRVDCEAELGDREREHDAEEESEDCLFSYCFLKG